MSVRTRKWIIVLTVVAFMLGVPMVAYRYLPEQEDSFFTLYKDNCAICHGENLEGSPQGPALVGVDLSHGDTVSDIRMGIAEGYPSGGMPAWSDVLRAGQLSSLAILVSEKCLNFDMTDLFDAVEIILPVDAIVTEEYNFRIE